VSELEKANSSTSDEIVIKAFTRGVLSSTQLHGLMSSASIGRQHKLTKMCQVNDHSGCCSTFAFYLECMLDGCDYKSSSQPDVRQSVLFMSPTPAAAVQRSSFQQDHRSRQTFLQLLATMRVL
jgi:hypothetical protein